MSREVIEEMVFKCLICGKEVKVKDIPEGLRPYYLGCSSCINPFVDYSLLKKWRGVIKDSEQ